MKNLLAFILSLLTITNASATDAWKVLFEDEVGAILMDTQSVQSERNGFASFWIKYIAVDLNDDHNGEWKKISVNCTTQTFALIAFKTLDVNGNLTEHYELPPQAYDYYTPADMDEPQKLLLAAVCNALDQRFV